MQTWISGSSKGLCWHGLKVISYPSFSFTCFISYTPPDREDARYAVSLDPNFTNALIVWCCHFGSGLLLLLSVPPPSPLSPAFFFKMASRESGEIDEVNSSFDASLVQCLDKFKVNDKVRTYLKNVGIETLEDAGLHADDEKQVWEAFCEPAGLSKTDVNDQSQKIACKKLWLAGRKVSGADSVTGGTGGAASSVPDDDAPLPPGTAETLQELWYKRHNFHLNGSRLVTDGTFNKIYRRVHAKPKKLEPIMLEKVRLQCNPMLDSKKGTFIHGKDVHVYEEVNDVVPNTHGIYLRIRAIFTTLSYVTVQDPSWFSFGDNENFCDLILDLLNRTYSGNGLSHVHPPLSFFQRAYVSMMSDFCQELRTVDTKLCELVARKSSWQHYWTGYIPDSGSVPSSTSGSSSLESIPLGIGRPDNASVDQQLKEALKMARQSQSQLDKQNAALRSGAHETDNGKGKDKANRGNKGKGTRKRGFSGGNWNARKITRES